MDGNTPIGFRGLAEYGERQFVDRRPWEPPQYMVDADPFFIAARTYADVAAEEALATPAGVATPNVEPGVSEFSYGRGLMAPLSKGHVPTQIEELKAVMRTNPADGGANHLDRYADWTREA